MISGDADAELRRLADNPTFPHADAARQALRFRVTGDAADLLAVRDDPHPCGMIEVIFALAGSTRPWLNWVPMPTETICTAADYVGSRRAAGEQIEITQLAGSAAEPASAVAACRRVIGPVDMDVAAFPHPDIRVPVRPGRYAVWRYDAGEPLPAVPPPSSAAIDVVHQVANKAWPSLLSGYLQAAPLGELPMGDLLGLLAHLPEPPDNARWQHQATTTPTYWYRLMQPWVCLGILHHGKDEPWPTSTRREVLVDLAFGVEDWVADSALFALVTAAYREPGLREEVRQLVRARLDAAVTADRLVTIEKSLAQLMLVTPGCTTDDRNLANAALSRTGHDKARPRSRRWWRHRD